MSTPPTIPPIPMAVRKLLSSEHAGRMDFDMTPWSLDYCHPVSREENDTNDDESLANDGSVVTVIEYILGTSAPTTTPKGTTPMATLIL